MANMSRGTIRNPAKSAVPSYNEVDGLINYGNMRDLLAVQSEHILKRQSNRHRLKWYRGEKTVF